MKRLISIILSFLFLLTATMPLYAYASVNTDYSKVSLLQEGSFDDSRQLPNLRNFLRHIQIFRR